MFVKCFDFTVTTQLTQLTREPIPTKSFICATAYMSTCCTCIPRSLTQTLYTELLLDIFTIPYCPKHTVSLVIVVWVINYGGWVNHQSSHMHTTLPSLWFSTLCFPFTLASWVTANIVFLVITIIIIIIIIINTLFNGSDTDSCRFVLLCPLKSKL